MSPLPAGWKRTPWHAAENRWRETSAGRSRRPTCTRSGRTRERSGTKASTASRGGSRKWKKRCPSPSSGSIRTTAASRSGAETACRTQPEGRAKRRQFINWHLADYFSIRSKVVAFTRSRAHRKSDNARVEQKNWRNVRQLVGYGRLEKPEQAEPLNTLYVKEWNLFRNFFCPTMKHIKTEVNGSRKKRKYDKPATPFERLKACADGDPEQIARLKKLKAKLRPVELKRRIEKSLNRLLKTAPE